jgi:hypothetical protein
MLRDVHPGSASLFFTHPGSRGQKGTGSGSATLKKVLFSKPHLAAHVVFYRICRPVIIRHRTSVSSERLIATEYRGKTGQFWNKKYLDLRLDTYPFVNM